MKKLLASLIGLLGLLGTANAEVNLGTCTGCHGTKFERPAMGVSKIVKDMNETDIAAALIGYKDGTYGRSMKGIMKGRVQEYSNEELNASAKAIPNLSK